MNWKWRVIVIVPDESKPTAEQLARGINSSGPEYDGDAFTVPLSASGLLPATHWALYTSATDEIVSAMISAMPGVNGARFWRHDIDGNLVSSNVTAASGQQWSYDRSISEAGLLPIVGAGI